MPPKPFGRSNQKRHVGYDKSAGAVRGRLSIQPGEMVGVAGRSGSGKSTLVSLIARLYEPDSGRILLDGTDVREISPRRLRKQIGMVPQEPFLFRGPVADNIAYGYAQAAPTDNIGRQAGRRMISSFACHLPTKPSLARAGPAFLRHVAAAQGRSVEGDGPLVGAIDPGEDLGELAPPRLPRRPQIPTVSPRRASNETSWKKPYLERPRTSNLVSPILRSSRL